MIGRLRGTLLEKRPPMLLLDVQGVGYELEAPMSTFYELPNIGDGATLHTHLVVKEDAHSLYGFATERERSLFRTLIKISGVGPKLALALLSGIRADDFIRCIEHQDVTSLVRLPGVGKKTAERLLIEMRDRVKDLGGGAGPVGIGLPRQPAQPAAEDPISDAVSALIALGYKPPEATRLVRDVAQGEQSSEEIIRLALQRAMK